MGFLHLAVAVTGFWSILHLSTFLRRRRRRVSHYALGSTPLVKSKSSDIQLNACYLRVETRRFNDAHERLSMWLAKSPTIKRASLLFYDLGIIFGFIGILFTELFLVWSIYHFLQGVYTNAADLNRPWSETLYKRQWQEPSDMMANMQHSSVNDPPVALLIPGVTIPFSHFIPLLLMLFIAQGLHEAAHALSAALESIPILSCGATLTVILPAAFVSLPSQFLERCSPKARLRVIASGAFHNLIIWATISICSVIGLGPFLWSLAGYQYIGHFGRSVTDIDIHSPLRQYLPIGGIITRLDDTSLMASDSTEDPWVTFLTRPHIPSIRPDLGWCVSRDWVLAHDDSCCQGVNNTTGLSCFTSRASSSSAPVQRCLPPLTILDDKSSSSARRCASASDCSESDLCINFRSSDAVLRIEYLVPDSLIPDASQGNLDARLRTVVWSGPRDEILADVRVSVYRTRFAFLPARLPYITGLLVEYLSTLSLSLFLFNLLPLPFLDGGQFLAAVLDFTEPYMIPTEDDEYDLVEAGNPVDARSLAATARWKKKFLHYTTIITTILFGGCFVSGLVSVTAGKSSGIV